MKLLFISNIAGKKVGSFSMSSILAAKEIGAEFHIAANLNNSSPTQREEDEEKYGIKLHHIDFARNPIHPTNLKAYKQLSNLIKKENYHAIHCNTPIGGILGRLCGKRANVSRVIYTAHGFHFYKGASIINHTLFKAVEIFLARFTDAIITINQEDYDTAQSLKPRSGGKIYYIPGVGIENSLIKDASSKREDILKGIGATNDSILLLSIGELNRNKNNRVVIKALGKLQNTKIHYLLCGLGGTRDELAELAKKNNIESNVHFLGYRNDVPQLLKSCNIFVLPSYREGLSRSVMEAMGAGLPCIVSKIRGNIDLIEDGMGGYLFHPDAVSKFAEGINTLTVNSDLRRTMGVYNLGKVKQFDIENVKGKMKGIYEKELF